jgi:hypothetical protein
MWVKINQGHIIVNLTLATRLYLMDETARSRGINIVADFGENRQLIIDRADTISDAAVLLAGYFDKLNTPNTVSVINNTPKPKAKSTPKAKVK